MTAFQAGFIEEAKKYGLSEKQATHMFYRASDYFEVADINKQAAALNKDETPDAMQELVHVIEQDNVDNLMRQTKKKIRL
jgi:hypothetical protein